MNLLDLENLARGTARQKQAYEALQKLKLPELLKDFSPVVAGTIPLDIDTPESDLDVICSTDNLVTFADKLRADFGNEEGFDLHHKLFKGQPTVVARFRAHGFLFEIFAQGGSVLAQTAVLHMLVEARLLTFAPPEAKERIRALKQTGLKTEPAFAEAFGISGDPYEELLKMARMLDRDLLLIAQRFALLQN